MRALVSNLTAFLLVVHAMIGCCHHHWHCDAECGPATMLTAMCGCCPPQDDAIDAEHGAGQPCDGSLECQGVCTYLPTSRAQLDDAGGDGGWELPFVVDRPTTAEATSNLKIAHRYSSRDALPAIRLNLLLQRLLI